MTFDPLESDLAPITQDVLSVLFTPDQLRKSGIGPGTVRLSIGLEDVDDLLADIDQALI